MNDFLNKIKNLKSNSEEDNQKVNHSDERVFLIDSSNKKNVIKKFDRIPQTDEINMPQEIVNLILGKNKNNINKNLLDMPIAATQILFAAIALVKNSQFNKQKFPKQLVLFDEEFMTEQNAVVAMVMDIKDLYSTKNANGKINSRADKVREAIDFLQNHFFEWVVGKNSDGKTVEEKLSFIERPKFTRGKLYFETSVFWAEKMINMKIYNPTLLALPKLLGNTRSVFFSLYLERMENDIWFQWNYENFNKLFSLNYPSARNLAKGFLAAIHKRLDENSLKSFAYKYSGDYIFIKPYQLKKLNSEEIILKQETILKLENSYYSNYLARRHKLSDIKRKNILMIISTSSNDKILIQEAYEEFKRNCKRKKVKVTDIIGEDFLVQFNHYILENYKKTSRFVKYPEGYPSV